MAIRAKRKNIKPDEYHHGVPNRDLEEEEYQALDTEQRKLVRESPLYDTKTDAEMSPATAASSEKPADAKP